MPNGKDKWRYGGKGWADVTVGTPEEYAYLDLMRELGETPEEAPPMFWWQGKTEAEIASAEYGLRRSPAQAVGQPFVSGAFYQPRYEPSWQRQMAGVEPSVSRPRYSWMERMFPRLMAEWEAKQGETTAEFERRQKYQAGEILYKQAQEEARWHGDWRSPGLALSLQRLKQAVPAREKSFAEFIRKYPWEREWGKRTPYERGFRWQYQPKIRKVGY